MTVASRDDLADAVAQARRELLNEADEDRRHNWHLARLWLGSKGGGPIVGGPRRRAMMPANRSDKEFLIKNRQQVPVASDRMFVGRRRELQTALRMLRNGSHAGVLLHGMGRLGKSSLAKRIVNRRPDLRPAVLFEHYGALDVLAVLNEALRDRPAARELLRHGTELIRRDPGRFEDVLTDLTCGPCAQAADGMSILLIIDDLERTLEADLAGGRHRVVPVLAPILRAVLRAFDPTRTDSRLIVTSRFPFTLDGAEGSLFELQLPPLSAAAQRKLELRQINAAIEKGLTGGALEERSHLLDAIPSIARGNPGLQDLIGSKIVLSEAVAVNDAVRVVQEMQQWLRRGSLPSDAEVRAFLEDLAINTLIELAGPTGKLLLQALTLFRLPVPIKVAEKLALRERSSVQHGRDLGLIDLLDDVFDTAVKAVAVNPLARGRLPPLTVHQSETIAQAIARDLFDAWGGVAGDDDRALSCDLELTQLGLLAKSSEIVETCAAGAVSCIQQENTAATAAEFGQTAIYFLEQEGRTVPWRLLSETAGAAATNGDGATADALIDRGVAALRDLRKRDLPVDPVGAGFLIFEHGKRLFIRGQIDQAVTSFEEAAELAKLRGKEISVTVARQAIADCLATRRQTDEALRILEEEVLPFFERSGPMQFHAMTLSKIGAIHFSRGELDDALKIHQQVLPMADRLGDLRLRAFTLAKIADIHLSRGELSEARALYEERLQIVEPLKEAGAIANTLWNLARVDREESKFEDEFTRTVAAYDIVLKLGGAEGIAVIGRDLGEMLAAGKRNEEALEVLRRSAEAFRRLGREPEAKTVDELIQRIG